MSTDYYQLFFTNKIKLNSWTGWIIDKKPEENWPHEGNIEFDKIFLKYNKSDKSVLNQITCMIRSKQKVDIYLKKTIHDHFINHHNFVLSDWNCGSNWCWKIIVDHCHFPIDGT